MSHMMTASPEAELLGRRMKALAEADLDCREWDEGFIADVCFRAPTGLSARQVAMIELLCWRYRDKLPPDLVPASEPKLPRSTR
ncbi:MAG: hypothetical protein K2X46_11100 [Roseomonas sp.]|nr:hypothetical protein [Roseomonas sp.]